MSTDLSITNNLESTTYFSINDQDFKIHFTPLSEKDSSLKTALLFVSGGFWEEQPSDPLHTYSLNFTHSGCVTFSADYPDSSFKENTVEDSITSLHNAILWMKRNHKKLQIDPTKIIVCGADSGAFLALSLLLDKKPLKDEIYTSSVNAGVFLSAVIQPEKFLSLFPSLKNLKGRQPLKLVRKKLPPMFFFHGNKDSITPIKEVEHLVQTLKKKGNTAHLSPFHQATHTFFHFHVNQDYFVQIVESIEKFLKSVHLWGSGSNE